MCMALDISASLVLKFVTGISCIYVFFFFILSSTASLLFFSSVLSF